MAEKNYLIPSQAVYKAYLRSYVCEDAMRNFIGAMKKFFESYDKRESEEVKRLVVKPMISLTR